jgi:hypothetical protein
MSLTSIKIIKQKGGEKGAIPYSLSRISPFLRLKPYPERSNSGTNYHLLQVDEKTLDYMRQNLFATSDTDATTEAIRIAEANNVNIIPSNTVYSNMKERIKTHNEDYKKFYNHLETISYDIVPLYALVKESLTDLAEKRSPSTDNNLESWRSYKGYRNKVLQTIIFTDQLRLYAIDQKLIPEDTPSPISLQQSKEIFDKIKVKERNIRPAEKITAKVVSLVNRIIEDVENNTSDLEERKDIYSRLFISTSGKIRVNIVTEVIDAINSVFKIYNRHLNNARDFWKRISAFYNPKNSELEPSAQDDEDILFLEENTDNKEFFDEDGEWLEDKEISAIAGKYSNALNNRINDLYNTLRNDIGPDDVDDIQSFYNISKESFATEFFEILKNSLNTTEIDKALKICYRISEIIQKTNKETYFTENPMPEEDATNLTGVSHVLCFMHYDYQRIKLTQTVDDFYYIQNYNQNSWDAIIRNNQSDWQVVESQSWAELTVVDRIKDIQQKEKFVNYFNLLRISGYLNALGKNLDINQYETEMILDIIDTTDRSFEYIEGYQELLEDLKEEKKLFEAAENSGIVYEGVSSDPYVFIEEPEIPNSTREDSPDRSEFPSVNDFSKLNILHNSILKEVSTKGRASEYVLVGFLCKPVYMLEILNIETEITTKPYKGSIKSIPFTVNALESSEDPILVSHEEFTKHCSCFREDHHGGKIYCCFYENGLVYAADEEHLYTLESQSLDSREALKSICVEIMEGLKKGVRDLQSYRYLMTKIFGLSNSKSLSKEIEISSRTFYDHYCILLKEVDGTFENYFRNLLNNIFPNKGGSKYTDFEEYLTTREVQGSGPKRFENLYISEALKYAFNLTKVNLKQNMSDNIIDTNSVHSEETFVCISVRTPLDIRYKKQFDIPYDVKIRATNINPKPTLDRIMSNPNIISSSVKSGKGQNTRIEFNDRYWPDRFHIKPKESGSNPKVSTIEVYDQENRSRTLYCSPNDYIYEIITGFSSNIYDVINSVSIIRSGQKIEHNGYPLPQVDISKIKSILISKGNKYFKHILEKPIEDIRSVPRMKEIVQQRLKEIAYTIFCRLKSSFGRLQDLTLALEKENNYRHTFMRDEVTFGIKESVETRIKRTQDEYTFFTVIASVIQDARPKLELMPTTDFRPLRTIAISQDDINKYYNILEENYENNSGSLTMSTKRTEEAPDYWNYVDVSFKIKEAVIANFLAKSEAYGDVRPDDLKLFRDAVNSVKAKKLQRQASVNNTSVHTGIGIIPTFHRDGSKTIVTIKDSINDRFSVGTKITFPIYIDATTITTTKPKEDPSYDSFFTGNFDMTLLMILDSIMFKTPQIVNKLFDIYNTNVVEFREMELGSYLHSEFVERNLDDLTIKRLYHIFSIEERNKVLLSNTSVRYRKQHEVDRTSVSYKVTNIQWN